MARASKRKAKKKGLSKVALIIIGTLLTIAITIIAVALYVFIYSFSYIKGDLKIDLKEYRYSQNQTSFVYAYNSKGDPVEVTRLYGTINRVWVDIEDTNPYIAKCYIGLEDKRFYEHSGVDWTRTIAAIVKYGGKQGGSTLTQQLIKNLTEEDEVTFVRKYKEILNALNLERYYSKEDIIEAYLNTVYLSHGCYGVKTAAETYFGKEISECNLAESAALAAITQFPSKYDPILTPENNKERRNYCLKLMYEQDLISKKEYEEAVKYKIKFQLNQKTKTEDDNIVYSYYTDAVINQVEHDLMEKYGYTSKIASNKINYGGLKIYSAVDLDIQESMDEIYTNREYVADESVQSAMTILDYDGRVVGIEGGIGEKTGRRELNRATDSPRQPGSTIKPISVYGPAIDTGATYWSKTYANSASMTINGQAWPKNQGGYGDGSYVTVQYGLAQSYNTISARVLTDLGLDTSYTYLKDKFCLKHLDPGDESYSPLATGSMTHGATALEMAAAFQAYGNGGVYHQPYFYYKVEDASGNVILDKADYDNHQAVEESTAEIMNHLLQTVMSMGTGTPYNVEGQTTFGKTGTTDDDKDRWFVGGTPYYVAAVWYGYDTPQEIYNVWNNPAGNLFKYVMDKIHAGLDSKDFPEAESGVTQAYYCSNSGMLASNGCSGDMGYYKSDDMPPYCSGHYYNSYSNGGSGGNGGGNGGGNNTDGGGGASGDSGGQDTSSSQTPEGGGGTPEAEGGGENNA